MISSMLVPFIPYNPRQLKEITENMFRGRFGNITISDDLCDELVRSILTEYSRSCSLRETVLHCVLRLETAFTGLGDIVALRWDRDKKMVVCMVVCKNASGTKHMEHRTRLPLSKVVAVVLDAKIAAAVNFFALLLSTSKVAGEIRTPGANSLHPDIAHLVASEQVETGETRTPGANSLHPEIIHLVAVAQVETGETRTPGANSLHTPTSLTWSQ